MTSRYVPDDIRLAAVADYHATKDGYKVVAARHGVSRSALHSWVNPKPNKPRGPWQWAEEDIALTGGRWVYRRGVRYWVEDEAA